MERERDARRVLRETDKFRISRSTILGNASFAKALLHPGTTGFIKVHALVALHDAEDLLLGCLVEALSIVAALNVLGKVEVGRVQTSLDIRDKRRGTGSGKGRQALVEMGSRRRARKGKRGQGGRRKEIGKPDVARKD